MERRTFLKSTMAGAAMAWKTPTPTSTAIPRRVYKGDVTISIIGFGGIVVVGMDQPAADRIVAEAFDRGVTYFDVAPSYFDGEAEMKLGPALKPHRNSSFLACKTMERDAVGARRELEQSLGRLKTDHFDLYQFHAVSKLDDVERIAAAGGRGGDIREGARGRQDPLHRRVRAQRRGRLCADGTGAARLGHGAVQLRARAGGRLRPADGGARPPEGHRAHRAQVDGPYHVAAARSTRPGRSAGQAR